MPFPRGSGLWTIVRVAGVITALTLLARAASLVREIVVAARLGAGAELDAFLIASVLPVFLVSAFANAIGPAFMPALVAARGSGDGGAAAGFRAVLGWAMGASLMVGGGAAVLLVVTAPLVIPLIGPALPAAATGLAVGLAVAIAFTVPLQVLVQLWSAALQAHDRFALPALAPILTPLAAVVALEALGGRLGVAALALGLIVGGVLEVAVLALGARRSGIFAWPRRRRPEGAPAALPVFALWGHVGAAVVLGTIPVFDQLMAGATGPGGVATFYFSTRLTSLLAGIGALAIGQAVLPSFSRHAVAGGGAELRRLYLAVSLMVFAASGVAAVGVALASGPLIDLLFQRGEFTAETAATVAAAQALYVLQVPFFLAWLIASKVLAALGRVALVLKLAAFTALLNVIGNALLMDDLAVAGVGLATTGAFAVSAAVTLLLTLRALGRTTPPVRPATDDAECDLL